MREIDQNQELLDDIVEDFTQRLRGGERPAIREYSQKHPALQVEIEELLTSVAMIEELKKQPKSQADSINKEMREICKLDHIGDYRIVKELGRGGMGIVFEAVHESLGRRVAIKVMPNRTFDDEKYLERFKREAHAAANLHHTNIVSVFGMGQAGDHRYYVMEFVDGMSLSEILAEINLMSSGNTQHGKNAETLTDQPAFKSSGNGASNLNEGKKLPPIRTTFKSPKDRFRWAAKLGMQIADGLAYAHGMGMLHRDIKPANLLVDRFETVWLTDFGLVKNISNQSITKSGDIIGTPQYMAPEAFEGSYDERSETYCLGLTLYEMVTLQPAYENASTPELIRRITTSSPVSPRKIDRRIPRDLNRIILKAISREPAYRYETAADMRNDLLAFLQDRPISARKISMTENLYRWSRRNPLAASLALLTGLMIFCVAVTSTVFLSISNRRIQALQVKQTKLNVEKRMAIVESARANKNLEQLSEWLDHMFMDLVLKDVPKDKEISLDGFDQLKGISTTVNETDAEFLSRMLGFYEWFIGSTLKEAFSRSGDRSNDGDTLKTAVAQGNAANILPDVRARSHRRIGNIYHLSGEAEKAIEAYDKAIEIYENLLNIESKSLPLRIDLAHVLNEKGQAIEMQGLINSRNLAVEQYRKAERHLKDRLEMDDPAIKVSGQGIKLELAKTLALIGAPHIVRKAALPTRFHDGFTEQVNPRGRNMNGPSIRHRNDALARMIEWFPRRQGNRDGMRGIKPKESLEALKEALLLVNKLLKIGDGETLDEHLASTSGEADNFVGMVAEANEKTAVELPALDTLKIDTMLLKATILTRMATIQVAVAESNSGRRRPNFRQSDFQHRRSLLLHRQALNTMNQLRAAGQAEMHEFEKRLAELKTKGTGADQKSEQDLQLEKALESELREIQRRIAQFHYAEALIRSTPIKMTTKQSIEELNKAKKILKSLVNRHERNHEYRKLLAEVSLRLGQSYIRQNDAEKAELNFRNALNQSSQLVQEAPRNLQIQYADFIGMIYLADLMMEREDLDRAEKTIRKSIESIEELPIAERRMPVYFHLLMAGRYRALAIVHEEQGDDDLARKAINKSLEIRKVVGQSQRKRMEDASYRKRRRSTASPN